LEERQEAREQLPEPMDLEEMEATAVRLEPQVMAAMEPQVMRCLPMAGTAATAEIPAVWRDWAEPEDPEPRPAARLELTDNSRRAVGMAGMAELVSARQRPAQLEAMADTEALADLLATVASEEPAATELRGRMALRDRCPGNLARTAKPEVRAEWAAQAVLADRFQVMAVMVASRATAEPEVTAEPASQARRGRIRETLAKPEGMEEMEPLAGPEDLAEWEVQPSMAWREAMDSEEMAAMAVQRACRATGAMARRAMHRVRTVALVAMAAIPASRESEVLVERAGDPRQADHRGPMEIP
jgi:hypothetical protein